MPDSACASRFFRPRQAIVSQPPADRAGHGVDLGRRKFRRHPRLAHLPEQLAYAGSLYATTVARLEMLLHSVRIRESFSSPRTSSINVSF